MIGGRKGHGAGPRCLPVDAGVPQYTRTSYNLLLYNTVSHINSAQDELEGQGNNPTNKGARKDLVQHDESQADTRSGKVHSISNLAGEVKVTGQRQTKLFFL
eukprot:7420051-Heterocapsa_arctica.AAC.1